MQAPGKNKRERVIMEIYALVGHSGTGKSHHAPLLASKFNIEHVIDDGLLIKGNLNLAGRSAKRENTRYGAIKRAVFKDPEQAQQVREKLDEIKPERLLILGTSRRMTEVIAKNLGLPEPTFYYRIEDISDPESIRSALSVRATENSHVIPLPTFAIKKDFPGYIIDPLRSFFSLHSVQTKEIPVERSVVRPIFSSRGSFYIAGHVITDLAKYIASALPGVYKVMNIELKNGKPKVILDIELAVDLVHLPGMRIDILLHEVQQTVKEEIEYQTGFYLDQVNIFAQKLHMGKEMSKDKSKLRNIVAPR